MSKRLRVKTDRAIQTHVAHLAAGPSNVKYGRGAKELRTYLMNMPAQARSERMAIESSLERFADALPVRALDPALVVQSRWGNRHPNSFATTEYSALKEEIRAAGGNVQPIKVRPLSAAAFSVLPGSTGRACYEIVFGHRRHRACLELGIPVLAMIEDLSDAELFAQMDRENRFRKNLSPWEQGVMYVKALDTGLFPSMRQLAAAIGCDPATVSRAMSLAQLPPEVIGAFRSPTDLQYRWAKPLATAIEKDRKAVLRRAERLRGKAEVLNPGAILAALLGTHAETESAGRYEMATLCHGGKRIGEVLRDDHQRTVVRFHRALPPPEQSEVVHAIQRVFKKR